MYCTRLQYMRSGSASSANRRHAAHTDQRLDRVTGSQAGDLQTAGDGIQVCAGAHGALFLGDGAHSFHMLFKEQPERT